MNSREKTTIRSIAGSALAVAAVTALGVPTAAAQGAADEELVEEIVITGTRKQGQAPTETLSPIDVLGGATLANQATFDMTDGITRVSPALNTQRFPIADGTAPHGGSAIAPAVPRGFSSRM